MLYIFFAMLLVVELMQYILLRGTLLFTVITVAMGLAGIVFGVLRKKVSNRITRLGWLVCAVGMIALMLVPGVDCGEVSEYKKSLAQAEKLLEREDYDHAMNVLRKMEEEYGPDDNTIYLAAIELTAKGDYAAAHEKLEQMSDKTSRLYYTIKEQIYRYDSPQDHTNELYGLYFEAAKEWPEWTYMQRSAGFAQLQQENYKSAAYFFEKALLLDAEDAQTYYYLGVADYHLGNEDTALACFTQAVEHGLEKDYEADIAWYLRHMEEE